MTSPDVKFFRGKPIPDIRVSELEYSPILDSRGLGVLWNPNALWWVGLSTPDKCEHKRKRWRKGPCQNAKNLVWCQTVGGTLLTLCRYHAHRGKRDRWVRDIAGEATT